MKRGDMKSDDIIIPNIAEIETINRSSSPRDTIDQVINATSEERASSSGNSSGSSPSDLKRFLQGLPSPNESALLTERATALSRQISHKRASFLHLHASAADRIEEDDEWAEREQKSGSESSLRAFEPKDARARRRARIRPKTSSRDDKAMVISRPGDPADGTSKVTDDGESWNPAEESVVNRSMRDRDYLRLPAIGTIPREQPPGSSLSEPSTTRQPPRRRESRDARSDILFNRSDRHFAPRDKSSDLRTVSPFALTNIRQMKFGGYRPPAGVLLKNLSSGSEPESANANASRERLPSVRKTDNPIVELSSAEPKIAAVDEPIKKMPIMSARSDITRSILPNLLPSVRSSHDDLLSYRRACIAGDRVEDPRINRDGSARVSDDEQMSGDGSAIAVYNDRTNRDEYSTRTCNELRRLESEYEDDEEDEVSQNAPASAAGSSISKSTELVTSNERILTCHDEPVARIAREFKQAESPSEDARGSEEAAESYRLIRPTTFEVHREYASEDTVDTADRLTSVSMRGTVDSSRLTDRIPRDNTTEEASSSEQFGSEDRSRSSCALKTRSYGGMLVREGTLSRFRDTSDEREREIMTNVPTLALNSRDVSCSTSAGSRECSATRPLDPRTLIKALSDVSLKQGEGWKNVSRKSEGAPRREREDDVSSGVSDLPAMGETWRVSTFLTSESPVRLPSRDLPSRIPMRIPSGKIISCESADRPPACRRDRRSKNLNATIANRETAILIDRNDVRSEVGGNIARRREKADTPYSRSYERISSRRGGVTEARSAASAEDGTAGYETNDYEPGSLTSSNLPSPRSTSRGYRRAYRETQSAFENEFGDGDRPTVFLDEAAYSGDRDFSKIDDERSDRSTSRKSTDTEDVTSVNGSPMQDDGPILEDQFGASRNVEENVAERGTEDECASSDDEENAEDAKDEDYYETHNNRPEDVYLQRKERFKAAIEETYDSLLFKTYPSRVGASSEIEKVAKKRKSGDVLEFHTNKSDFDRYLEATKVAQSDSLVFQIRRTHEVSSFATNVSSSTLNLGCETKRKKKSQDRFPFTISEASEPFPAKRKNTADCQPPDKDFHRTNVDNAEETMAHRLKVHPSITRLATAGLEDTVAEILCCAVQNQKDDKSSSRSRIKGLVRMFSAKLRRGSKQRNDIKTPDVTEIIYENRVCQEDSRTNSCSGGSSTEGIQNTNRDQSSDTRWIAQRVARSNPTHDENILRKSESLEAIHWKHPRRRYDRDDLWVQNLKFSLAVEDDDETLRKRERTSPSRDRYSIFLAKNLQSAESTESKTEHDNSIGGKQRDALVTGRAVPSTGKSKNERIRANLVSEEIEEDLTGCLCSGLCRLIAPSKYRLSIREQVSSPKTKVSNTLLRKRKKC